MLGVCLLFVGIVLINNGVCSLMKVEAKAAAVMNLLVGGLSVFVNFVAIVKGDYYAAATGLLFGFTYLFVALNGVSSVSWIPFSAFCLESFSLIRSFICSGLSLFPYLTGLRRGG